MKFYYRIILTFLAIVLILVSGLAYSVYFFYSDEYRLYLEKIRQSEFDKSYNISDLKNQSFYRILNDYASWTDMAEFVKSRDTSWAATNISLIDFSTLQIYNNRGEKIYQNQQDSSLTDLGFTPDVLQSIFNQRKTRHFFDWHGNLLIEFFGSTIHNSDDLCKKGESYGYLLCGRIWNEPYMRTITANTGTQLSILDKNHQEQQIVPADGLVVNNFALLDYDQQVVANLRIETNSQLLQDFYRSNVNRVISLAVFVILLVMLLLLILFQIKKHILQPISKIIIAAEQEEYENLPNELAGGPEFLPVAERIMLSFQQKKYLQCLNEELFQLKESLELSVIERTRELQQSNTELKKTLSELQQSYDLIVAQEKLVSLGTMVAGIAHEINNPVQAIKFSVEALRLNITDIKEFADEINQMTANSQSAEMKHLQQVVTLLDLNSIMFELDGFVGDNLKAVERIQNIVNSTKRMVYTENSFVPCNLNGIITDAITLLSGQIKNLVTIKLELQPDLPEYLGMPQELGQIFINLITNAKDAMQESGLPKEQSVLIISSSYNPERKNLKIVFQDNGCGMPKATIDKIFDPFFTTKPSGKGTGLGLNIVFKILETHNGTIEVESEPGQGTAFIIYLPCK